MKIVQVMRRALFTGVVLVLAIPLMVNAQEAGSIRPEEKFSQEELAQMLAPVALYPDALLSQVLMAATYPLEVIEADRWAKKNTELKGDKLDEALLEEDWDPSVKSLCHFPTVLGLMSERIAETTDIGNAFLAQEQEVMDMVQVLRTKAYEQGNLKTTSEQKVVKEKQTIIIEPANPEVIYVPYYDPLYVYGPWWYPAYRPYYWGPARVSVGASISFWPGFFFGFGIGSWSYFDWPRHSIYIDVRHRPRFIRHNEWDSRQGDWRHLPRHRRGVVYRDRHTAGRFGQSTYRQRPLDRKSRGFADSGGRGRGRGEIETHRSDGDHSGRDVVIREKETRKRLPEVRDDRGRQPSRNIEVRRDDRRGGDTIFDRVERGRSESRSGDRGRGSRENSRRDFSGKGRSGGVEDGGPRSRGHSGRNELEDDGGQRGRGRGR